MPAPQLLPILLTALAVFAMALAAPDVTRMARLIGSPEDGHDGFWRRAELHKDWWSFKREFGKVYADYKEEYHRMLVFADNMAYVRRHNRLADQGLKTYRLGVNHFADMTHAEFLDKMTGLRRSAGELRSGGATYISPATKQTLPDSVDWRQQGAVTPVKDQGQCGSCWSFSTTGALEGQQFRKTGSLRSFSEQQLVDCSGAFGNQGCNGGLMDNAFQYVKQYGIELESAYPYTATEGTCKYQKSKVVASCTGFMDVTKGSEAKLQEAVANVGPVSVAIDASHPSFQLYKSGVYNEPDCSSTELDHAVLVVGYGTDAGADYWLVKNSWNTRWGEQGYVRMSRNKSNQCGIASMASYPTV